MNSVSDVLRDRFKCALKAAYDEAAGSAEPAIVSASNPTFGDYQCNVAMALSKPLKQPPRAIAEKIVAHADISDLCEPAEIAGPGFINLRLKPSFLEQRLNAIKSDPRLGVGKPARPKRIVVDMSSPNSAKEMHVGHLRSTIIGECLARVFAFLGHDVLKVNHVGDWGTQFGMLIAYLAEVCPQALKTPDVVNLGDLVTFYKEAKKRFDGDPQFQETARLQVVKLQKGDEDSLRAWRLLCDQSRRENQVIYDMLDIKDLVERGESFYNHMLPDVVQELTEKGLVVEDQGARCIFLEGFTNEQGGPLPFIIQKKDGGFNYSTTDLAALNYRLKHDKADQLIYVVDAGQSDHFGQLFQVARRAGWLTEGKEAHHVPFGVVQGEDGKKLKTRSGETIRLKDLLEEAILAARQELDAKLAEEGRHESEEFAQAVASAVGLGAVKYADLSLNRMTNYIFSYKKMLSLQGNTAPYMMYAYVRIQGISRKGGIDFERLGADAQVILSQPTEIELAKHLLRLEDTLESVAQDLLPNRICDYLFELSQKFNQFYEQCPVLNAAEPVRTGRLILCHLTALTIKLGLTLLGIRVLERM